jgi:hypothetical protein
MRQGTVRRSSIRRKFARGSSHQCFPREWASDTLDFSGSAGIRKIIGTGAGFRRMPHAHPPTLGNQRWRETWRKSVLLKLPLSFTLFKLQGKPADWIYYLCRTTRS